MQSALMSDCCSALLCTMLYCTRLLSNWLCYLWSSLVWSTQSYHPLCHHSSLSDLQLVLVSQRPSIVFLQTDMWSALGHTRKGLGSNGTTALIERRKDTSFLHVMVSIVYVILEILLVRQWWDKLGFGYQDFQNPDPFFETGIETFVNPISWSRLGSLGGDPCDWYWHWDFQLKM